MQTFDTDAYPENSTLLRTVVCLIDYVKSDKVRYKPLTQVINLKLK